MFYGGSLRFSGETQMLIHKRKETYYLDQSFDCIKVQLCDKIRILLQLLTKL